MSVSQAHERYRQHLMAVSDGLSDDDLNHMLFLCRDELTRQEADSVESGYELFNLLEERRLLGPSNTHLLMDLLKTIGKDCLIDHIEHLSPISADHIHPRCQIRFARLSLFHIGMELDETDFYLLKSTCGCRKEEITLYYQLLAYLENNKKISMKYKVDVNFLLDALEKAHLLDDDTSKLPAIVKGLRRDLQHDEFCYRMTSNPKGVCVIINNVDFKDKNKRRDGSNYDRDLLKRLFNLFKYRVEVYENLTSKKIISTLNEISKQDHWLYDCFICCVLSHGSLGSVFGVDDVAVKIQKILDLFSVRNCPSLADKPKVFFLQACQGSRAQPGSSIPSSQGLQLERVCGGSVKLETCQTLDDAFIDEEGPAKSDLEAHLLLGYATPPGYKSYRDATKGSWYINELVDTLTKYAATEHILDILTKVNDEVARKEGIDCDISVKQIPYPTFTLQKKLYLVNKEDIA